MRPFKGDPSLDFKWAAAKHIEQVAATYPGKPLVVLYFGDLDPKGLQIPLSARDDVQSWCSAEFSFSRCGLSPGDEVRYNLPENIDKPGTYQWEALGDEDARALITGNLASYVDPGILDEIEAQEEEIAGKFQAELSEIISRWKKEVA